MDMVKEKLIDWKTAILRNPADQLDQLLAPDLRPAEVEEGAKVIATGLPAGPGAASGKIYLNADRAVAAAAKGEKVLLVRNETSPEDLRGMIAAEGILTAHGGVSSHAALVARQMGKVCVCGAGALQIDYAAKTVTAAGADLQGRRLPLHRRHAPATSTPASSRPPPPRSSRCSSRSPSTASRPRPSECIATLMNWCSKVTRLQVRTNADTPEQTENAIAFGATGIGLTRTEHMFFEGDRIDAMREMILADNVDDRKKPRSPSCCPTSATTSPASSRR